MYIDMSIDMSVMYNTYARVRERLTDCVIWKTGGRGRLRSCCVQRAAANEGGGQPWLRACAGGGKRSLRQHPVSMSADEVNRCFVITCCTCVRVIVYVWIDCMYV